MTGSYPPVARDTLSVRAFSTDVVPPPERHDFWQSQGWPSVGRMYEYRPDPGFAARSSSLLLDGISISVGHYSAQIVERSAALVRGAPVDSLYVSIPLDTTMATEAGRVAPGGALMLDLAQPWRHRSERGAMAVLGVPRSLAIAHGIDPRAVHGGIVATAGAAMLRRHVVGLVNDAAAMPVALASGLSATIVDLLGTALADGRLIDHPARTAMRDTLYERARCLILMSLRDPRLDADYLARALGISRAGLYRLFADDGGVRRYIHRARLAAAGDLLIRTSTSIKDAADLYHFADATHFSRAFRLRHGTSPSRWRAFGPTPSSNGIGRDRDGR